MFEVTENSVLMSKEELSEVKDKSYKDGFEAGKIKGQAIIANSIKGLIEPVCEN